MPRKRPDKLPFPHPTEKALRKRFLERGESKKEAKERAQRIFLHLNTLLPKNLGLTTKEALAANRFGEATGKVFSFLQKEGVRAKLPEAANAINLYNTAKELHFNPGPFPPFERFLQGYAELRVEMEHEPSREQLPDFIQRLGRKTGFKTSKLMQEGVERMRRNCPDPSLDFAVSVAHLYARAERAGTLNQPKTQQNILVVAFNKALGESDSTQERIRMAVRALDGDPTPDLLKLARKRIRDFDSLPDAKKQLIIRNFRLRELASIIPTTFAWYARQADPEKKAIDPAYQKASAKIMEWLESAENRMALARQATIWFKRKET